MWAGFVGGEKARGGAGMLERFKWRMIVIWLSQLKKSSGGKRLAGRAAARSFLVLCTAVCFALCHVTHAAPDPSLRYKAERKVEY